jgi:hypothetical protein
MAQSNQNSYFRFEFTSPPPRSLDCGKTLLHDPGEPELTLVLKNKHVEVSERDYQSLLRTQFYLFIERSFYELNPQTRFLSKLAYRGNRTGAGGAPLGQKRND